MNDYLLVIIIMSVALAMDAFAVAITLGMDGAACTICDRIKVASSFGFFQGLLFVIGVISLSYVSGEVTSYNHLIAGVILIILGLRMLKESFEKTDNTCPNEKCRKGKCTQTRCLKTGRMKNLTFYILVMFGIATSIDALAAGITYGLIYEEILIAVVLISVIAFLFSYIGAAFGKKLGYLIGKKANIFGGIMIILLGLKSLFF